MADQDKILDHALDLMRRLPPQLVEKHLYKLIDICPEELAGELLQTIDVPLQIQKCEKFGGKEFLCCDYNRDGDSYRSPWSGEYQPADPEAYLPPANLRDLEVALNDAFTQYCGQYYQGALSSVYLWELDADSGSNFEGVVLIKKQTDEDSGSGCWDSINTIQVDVNPTRKTATYKLNTTVMLWLKQKSPDFGMMNLSGSLTRVNETEKVDKPITKTSDHIKHIGELVENMENNMRSGLAEIYFSKTLHGVNMCRSINPLANDDAKRQLALDIAAKLNNKDGIIQDKRESKN